LRSYAGHRHVHIAVRPRRGFYQRYGTVPTAAEAWFFRAVGAEDEAGGRRVLIANVARGWFGWLERRADVSGGQWRRRRISVPGHARLATAPGSRGEGG
jgi:hypothetical protein